MRHWRGRLGPALACAALIRVLQSVYPSAIFVLSGARARSPEVRRGNTRAGSGKQMLPKLFAHNELRAGVGTIRDGRVMQPALRYALAPACVVLGMLVYLSPVGPTFPLAGLFVLAVLVAAWFGGAGPGFLAAVLAVLAIPRLSTVTYPLLGGFLDVPRFLTFSLVGLAVGWWSFRRRQVEAALRESEKRYALAMEAAGDGHTDWNLETGEFYISPRLAEDLRLSRREPPSLIGPIGCAAFRFIRRIGRSGKRRSPPISPAGSRTSRCNCASWCAVKCAGPSFIFSLREMRPACRSAGPDRSPTSPSRSVSRRRCAPATSAISLAIEASEEGYVDAISRRTSSSRPSG